MLEPYFPVLQSTTNKNQSIFEGFQDLKQDLNDLHQQDLNSTVRINGHSEKIDKLWLNFLNQLNLTDPIVKEYTKKYADTLRNDTLDRIWNSINAIEPSQINLQKQTVQDNLGDWMSIKLNPIDDDLTKVIL